MTEEVYQQLIQFIHQHKGWKYVGNNQALIPVKDLINFIKAIKNNEV